MEINDKMTINERYKYLRIKRMQYKDASKSGKSKILDEIVEVTGYHRNSASRLLRGEIKRRKRKRQRGRSYGIEVKRALMIISEAYDYICAERLTPNLVMMAEQLERHGEIELTPKLRKQLSRISVSTVKRVLARNRQDQPRLPRKSPGDNRRMVSDIPVRVIPWDEQEPGHFEVDLVHHCGHSANGLYVHSLQMVDVATGWSERVATLGRSYVVMEDGFLRILTRLPFPIKEIHSDNGSEFLQHHMQRFWKEEVKGVKNSRGRPYQKNDQRFVEQKNSTLIRKYFGSSRKDTVLQTIRMNKIYEKMWIFYNFFQPVMRLKEKRVVVANDGSRRIRRLYDQAQTPFQRLCETGVLKPHIQQKLKLTMDKINPRQLRHEIYRDLLLLRSLHGTTSSKREDVRLTLITSHRYDEDLSNSAFGPLLQADWGQLEPLVSANKSSELAYNQLDSPDVQHSSATLSNEPIMALQQHYHLT